MKRTKRVGPSVPSDRCSHGLPSEAVQRMGAVWEALRVSGLGGLLGAIAEKRGIDPGAVLFAQTPAATSARVDFVEAAHARGWSYADVCAVLHVDRRGMHRKLAERRARNASGES